MHTSWMIAVAVFCTTLPSFGANDSLSGSISLSGAWALYPMVIRWSDEFRKVYPDVQFDISAGGAGKGMTDVLAQAVDIGMVSREVRDEEKARGALPIAVTKDAVIPMINIHNPGIDLLRKQGLKKDAFSGIWIRDSIHTWGKAVGTQLNAPIRVYTRSDACGAAQIWAAWLGAHQEDLTGIGIYGDPGLAEAVQKDVLGIGYNNVNFAYDNHTGLPANGLTPLPIDLNGNGRIDSDENFYASRDDLTQAIADERYPSPPARNLYFVTKGIPSSPCVQAFIIWVLTDGQQFIRESGYITLKNETLRAGMNLFDNRHE